METRWKKEPILFHYRRYSIFKVAIPICNEVQTHSLFAGVHPIRIFLAIVESKKSAGTQDSSPFEFYRRWSYETLADQQVQSVSRVNENDERLRKMEEMLFNLSNLLTATASNKTSEKGKQPSQHSLIEQAKRLLNKDVDDGASTSSRCTRSSAASEIMDDPDPPNVDPVPTKVTKSVYLTKCQLMVDNQELGNSYFVTTKCVYFV